LSDLTAAGLSNVICKDGQSTVTADIPFGGHRLTNVGDPTADTDAMKGESPDLWVVDRFSGDGGSHRCALARRRWHLRAAIAV